MGWPSFKKPLEGAQIKEETYELKGIKRTKLSDNSPEGNNSHLGVLI